MNYCVFLVNVIVVCRSTGCSTGFPTRVTPVFRTPVVHQRPSRYVLEVPTVVGEPGQFGALLSEECAAGDLRSRTKHHSAHQLSSAVDSPLFNRPRQRSNTTSNYYNYQLLNYNYFYLTTIIKQLF